MKEILIINGRGGVGKGSFVEALGSIANVRYASIIDPVKAIAKMAGWNGEKTEESRLFLYHLKRTIDKYNDSNYNFVRKQVEDFKNDPAAEILCIDMREKDDIDRAIKDFEAKTVMITNSRVEQITSNPADANVFKITYDYSVKNNGTLADLTSAAKRLYSQLKAPTYKKVVYISHPFGGLKENLEKIEQKILSLTKRYPNHLFLSPCSMFGFKYDTTPYEEGLKECLWLLSQADEMWVFGDHESSQGCQAELSYCRAKNIPYLFLDENTHSTN